MVSGKGNEPLVEEIARNLAAFIEHANADREPREKNARRSPVEDATAQELFHWLAYGSKLTKADAARLVAHEPAGLGQPLRAAMRPVGQNLQMLVVNIVPSPKRGEEADTNPYVTAKPSTCTCDCKPNCGCLCRDPKKDDYFCLCLLEYDKHTLSTFPLDDPVLTLNIGGCRLVVVTIGQDESSTPKFMEELRKALTNKEHVSGKRPVSIVRY